MNCMIYNWRLSPVEPFAWETQRYAGPAQFPLLDMHKSIHLVTLSDGELSGNIGGGGFEFHAGDFYLTSPWEIHGAISSRKGFELLLLTVNPDVLFSSLLYGRERLEAVAGDRGLFCESAGVSGWSRAQC